MNTNYEKWPMKKLKVSVSESLANKNPNGYKLLEIEGTTFKQVSNEITEKVDSMTREELVSYLRS
jgi:regulatory protein YycI of two-component signal transduction system YycFG